MWDHKRNRFLYTLIRAGKDGQDLYFKRIYESSGQPNVWAMHMDIEDLKPENALIFVNGKTTKREEIMDAINKVQTYFRSQIEPQHPENE